MRIARRSTTAFAATFPAQRIPSSGSPVQYRPAMNLSQHLAPQLSSDSRSRGASYFRRGAVQQIEEVAGAIEATVIGSVAYRVRLEPNGHRLLVTCTCPYFLDRIEPCKHVWAALLAAEARSLRVLAPGIKP